MFLSSFKYGKSFFERFKFKIVYQNFTKITKKIQNAVWLFWSIEQKDLLISFFTNFIFSSLNSQQNISSFNTKNNLYDSFLVKTMLRSSVLLFFCYFLKKNRVSHCQRDYILFWNNTSLKNIPKKALR